MDMASYWNQYGARDSTSRERPSRTKDIGSWPAPKLGPAAGSFDKQGALVKSGLFQNHLVFRRDFAELLAAVNEAKGQIQAPVVDGKLQTSKGPGGGAWLYRESMRHRREACKHIKDLLEGQGLKVVNADNEYPCLLVKTPGPPTRADSRSKGQWETNKDSWTSFVMAHFTGIANAIAMRSGVPIEMVMRASFGHFAPSVAATGESFRINVGLIPREYQEVLAHAIKVTHDIFQSEYKAALQGAPMPASWSDLMKRYLAAYAQKNGKSAGSPPLPKDLWQWLWSKGDAVGHTVMYQLTERGQKRIEELADEAYATVEGHLDAPPAALAGALAGQLAAYPSRFVVDEKKATVSLGGTWSPKPLSAPERQAEIKDPDFWALIKGMMSALDPYDGGSEAEAFAQAQSVSGLYAALERQNLEFVKRVAPIFAYGDDGGASDSDEEGDADYDDVKFYSKKLITTTGMRAILLAHYGAMIAHGGLTNQILVSNVNVTADKVYYEAPEAFKKVPIQPDAAPPGAPTNVAFFDLNHCNTTHVAPHDVSFVGQHVVVLDHTSASPSRVNGYLNKAFKEGAQVVFLVASGLKNEQCGADMNPYGVIRVVTKDPETRNRIYEALRNAESGYKHPLISDAARRAFKSIGALSTTAEFLGKIAPTTSSSTSQDIASLMTPPPSSSSSSSSSSSHEREPKKKATVSAMPSQALNSGEFHNIMTSPTLTRASTQQFGHDRRTAFGHHT